MMKRLSNINTNSQIIRGISICLTGLLWCSKISCDTLSSFGASIGLSKKVETALRPIITESLPTQLGIQWTIISHSSRRCLGY